MRRLFMMAFLFFFSTTAFAVSNAERRALSVPKSFEDDMRQLVHYLTDKEPDRYEQAKSIAVWIASHISYDNYTYAAGVGKASGHSSSRNLEKGKQDADTVFKNRIGTCVGYVNLYEKMLTLAGIHSQKVQGYIVEHVSTPAQAKTKVKQKNIGHVWTQVKGIGRSDVLVDVTWMSRGMTGETDKQLTNQMKKKEVQKIKRENKQTSYEMKYFDFDYKKLQKQGEYRFSENRKLLQK